MNATGIDVSSYQPTTPNLAGRSFLFARASIGLRTDSAYAQHIVQAKRAGIATGAYHFGLGSYSIAEQARLFVHAAGVVDLYVIDVEGGDAFTKAETALFIGLVRAATGARVGLYHSLSGFFNAGQDFNWVADYDANSGQPGTPPPIDWTFWQYTSAGHIAGYDGRLDLDQYHGTPAQLSAWLAGGVIPPDSSTGDPVSLYVPVSGSGTFVLPAGITVRAWQPTDQSWVVAKTWSGHAASSGRYDYGIQGPDTPSNLVHCVGGFFDGLYVATSEIKEVPDPPAPTYSDGLTKGYADAKKAATQAVASI